MVSCWSLRRCDGGADLEWLVVPAVLNGQFFIAEAQLKGNGMVAPVGVVLWASVSPAVDQRLAAAPSSPLRLQPAEWRSGEHLWVIEAIGDGDVVQAMLKRKLEKDWTSRTVKMRVRDKAGVMQVGTLGGGK
jgi:cytolysin-activating lysine-acyltransferase